MHSEPQRDQLPVGKWIMISEIFGDDLICFTYIDPSKGLCAKGDKASNPDLAEQPSNTIHSLARWKNLKWRLLEPDEHKKFHLPLFPGWLQYYGPQPNPDMDWDPMLDDPVHGAKLESIPKNSFRLLSNQWKIGDTIDGAFKIEQILGGPGMSGMGIVYVGYSDWLGKVCALKTLQDVYLNNALIADRFKQEALAWISLDAHENVTQAFSWQYFDNRPCLLMEYVGGGDLGHWIGTPRLTNDLALSLRFAIDFCKGMLHAVSKGIRVHRDIKPQNCLITSGDSPVLKVTDFGLAKVMDDSNIDVGMSRLPYLHHLNIYPTKTGQAAGTCTHMAPEQFDDAGKVDIRADVYAFGVMLFQMVTGRLPFLGRSWQEFRDLHKTSPWPPLSYINPKLEKIINSCLAKDPKQRYTDFDIVLHDLTVLYHDLTGQTIYQRPERKNLDEEQLFRKAMSLGFLGRKEEALALHDKAISAKPNDSITDWIGKTNVLRTMGRNEEAVDCADQALSLYKTSGGLWGLWLAKGLALHALERLDEAMDCYNRAIELDPGIDMTWTFKGDILIKTKRYEEAVKCYEQLVKLMPNNPDNWWNLGEALRKSGSPAEAITNYNQAITLNPDHYPAWLCKGLAVSAQHGQSNKEGQIQAFYCLDKALEINPKVPDSWFNKGLVLIFYKRENEAIISFTEAQKLGHKMAGAMITVLQEKLGR